MKSVAPFLIYLFLLTGGAQINGQTSRNEVPYTIVAQSHNSPLNDVLVICDNKYFNLEVLPQKFRPEKILEDKPHKKMMLVQIFLGE